VKLSRLFLALAGILAALPPGSAVAASPETERPASPSNSPERAEWETLLLAVMLNSAPTHVLLTVLKLPDKRLLARASELRALRVQVDPGIVKDDLVALSAIPNLDFAYDEPSQTISLTVGDQALKPYQIELGTGRRVFDATQVHSTPGAIVNYSVYATRTRERTAVAGTVGLIGMIRGSAVTTDFNFNSDNRWDGKGLVRLDSSWRLIDPVAVRSYTIGDFASNALPWSNSVRLGGFQIASAFEQRPDIVTTPLPRFAGSAALPSTLDLYLDQQRIFSGEIPSGPFDIQSLPQVSGGKVRLVTTDLNGRQVEIVRDYYYVSSQLRAGLLEYSVEAGFPRRDFGFASFSYDSNFSGSGSVRYGLTQATTVEGHIEGAVDGLVNGGVGIVQGLGGHGALTVSISGSHYKSRDGARVAVKAEGRIGPLTFFAGTERSFGDYFDLARVAVARDRRRRGIAGSDDLALAPARATTINRAGLSFGPMLGGAALSLNYNQIRDRHHGQRLANLSLSRPVSDRVTAYVSAYSDLDRRRSYGVFAMLNIRIGKSTMATVSAERDRGRSALEMQVEGLAGQRQGDFGWGLSNRVVMDGPDSRRAYVSYRAPQALVRARVAQAGGDWLASLEVEGAVVAAGGGMFLANRIGNGFVIVKNAGPGTEVLQGGVRMGKANHSGRALLPDMLPNYPQQIFLDPATMADGWEPEATERIAVSGYRQGAIVDFGTRRVHSAVVVLQDAAGQPIEAGYVATVEGGESAVIGYDGEVYLRGLRPDNRLSVDRGIAGRCHASFTYKDGGSPQAKIGPLACR
jgi:outer membrane usher protein